MSEAIQFLFPSFLACIPLVLLLGYLGTHVLEREIIFIDIALAQVAAVGYAVGFLVFGHDAVESGSPGVTLLALGATLVAAAFFSYVGRKTVYISQETVIGVSYAIAAALTLFLLATAAGGDVHLEEMLTGSILWVQTADIVSTVVIFGAVGLFHWVYRKRFLTVSSNYHGAEDHEKAAFQWWDFLFYVTMGIVITQAVKLAGVLLTFALLIFPGTFAALFVRQLRIRLMLAWTVGIVMVITGMGASYLYDYSTGPAIVACLGIALVAGALISRTLR
jgi:zinc/manganese transport system permease protein